MKMPKKQAAALRGRIVLTLKYATDELRRGSPAKAAAILEKAKAENNRFREIYGLTLPPKSM